VGKKQRHKEKLKLAGLDDSDSSALTQSGDEMGESSPPPQDPSRPGTEGGTEAGDEDAEMAERSSPGGGFHHSFGPQSTHPSTPQNLRQSRNPQKFRKVPRKVHLPARVPARPLRPLEPSRNESGRMV
jgi:hypothetical protein